MKKMLFIFSLLFCFSAKAQFFTITPDGLRDSENLENSYIVLEAEGKTAAELYKLTLDFIQINYLNPNLALKGTVENEYISLESSASGLYFMNGGVVFDVILNNYFRYYFKDGKVKIEVYNPIMITEKSQMTISFGFRGGLAYSLLKKNGDVRMDILHESILSYFNDNTIKLAEYLKTGTPMPVTNDDW